MTSKMLPRLRRLRDAEDGGLSVEAVLIFPLLFWAFGGLFVFWDAYKTQNDNLKAAFTVADMISREVVAIDAEYIEGAQSVYQFLTRSIETTDIRVSVVSMGLDANDEPVLELEWSHGTGTLIGHTDPKALEDVVPTIAVGDEMIVVETRMPWEPMFAAGLMARDMTEVVVAKPRYVPQVLWDDGTEPTS